MFTSTIGSHLRSAPAIALLGLAAAGGCSYRPASPVDGGGSASGVGWTPGSLAREHCSTPTRSDVPECNGTFCAPGSLDIEVRWDSAGSSWKCSGYSGALHCQGNDDHQAFLLEHPAIHLYLSFSPKIVHEREGEAVVRHFQYLWMRTYFPDRRADGVFELLTFSKGNKAIKRFEVRDDLLEIEIEPSPLNQAHYLARSTDFDCLAGDIVGSCACPFRLPGVPVRVKATLDLRAVVPGN